MSGFGRGKRKAAVAESGTGYGGQQNDTKRLVAGRKKAQKSSIKDDNASIRFLKKLQKQLLKCHKNDTGSDIDDDDREKLSPLLADTFRNQIPADWDDRKELYNIALDVCLELSRNESLGKVIGEQDDQEGVLYWLLGFRQHAKDVMKRHDSSGWSKEDEGDAQLATHVIEVADKAMQISRRCHASKPVADLSVISLSERYQSQLGPLRFDSVESMQTHFFLNKVTTAPASLNTRLLFKELSAYRTALPVEYGSSCFCRVINCRLDMLRVMITGPDETPYANGCFFFDINIPTNYPQVAPKVQFLTTALGTVRFNPNLYKCGKVCLSLLGTWAGPGWVSGQSTLLQVLISIQSLILVPDPYFNEPGWEPQRGTPRGSSMSESYNKKIRRSTVSAAIEPHLTSILSNCNQYTEFESIMCRHFLEKRFLIQKELYRWVKDDPGLAPRVNSICSLFETLANRERGTRSRGNRKRGNEPIVLDDAGIEKTYQSQSKKAPNGALKLNEIIEIDLSNSDETAKLDCLEKEKKRVEETSAKNSESGNRRCDDMIDLT